MSYSVFLLGGGSGTPKLDINDRIKTRDWSSVLKSKTTTSDIYSVGRLSELQRICVGGRNIFNEFNSGHIKNLFIQMGLTTDSYVYVIEEVKLLGITKLYIGTSDGKLFSYDGTTFVNLTSNISAVWGTNPILSIKGNGSYLLIGGGEIGVSVLLYKYDGTTWTDLSGSSTLTDACTAIDYSSSLGYWLLGANNGDLESYTGSAFSDRTVAAGLGGKKVNSIKWFGLNLKFYIGCADKVFKSFDGTDYVDLSSNLSTFGAGDDIEGIMVSIFNNMVFVFGNGKIMLYEYTSGNWNDGSALLVGLTGVNNIRTGLIYDVTI